MVTTGLDQIQATGWARFRGKRIGIVCHQASVDRSLQHILDLALVPHRAGDLKIGAVFGPQHGIWGHTQDNMIEWEGYIDERTGLKFYSLYGEWREPSPEMLEGLDELVFDVQDVGARYYTFIWTLALCLKACASAGVKVTVLDRPNPINGVDREGPGHDPAFASFVGLHPLPVRHGMTVGEVARHLRDAYYPTAQLEVIDVEGWDRKLYGDETGLPWAMPSPNMPSVDTAVVYPGQCLLEGTELSEGRGTTRPFEIFGAPFIDGWELADALNAHRLLGVLFRPIQFLPTFQKHAGTVCQGCYMHVTDRRTFRSVESTVTLLHEIIRRWPNDFVWKQPPYEYEYTLMPFDILAGGAWLRESLASGSSLKEIRERIRDVNPV